MDLNEIYTLCNWISNKHKSGNAFTPNQFNSLIEILNRDFFKKKIEESGFFENRKNMSYNEVLRGSKNLHKFIVNETVSAGSDLSYTFAYFIGGNNTANNVPIDLVTEREYHDRLGDSVMVPSADAPVAVERGDYLVVKPDAVTQINMSYYRYPNTPFLDYYVDTNGVRQFLSAGATHTWANSETDSAGTGHSLGDADWSSLTVELEIGEGMHNDFMNEILSRAGVRLEKQAVIQMAEAYKAEQKQM